MLTCKCHWKNPPNISEVYLVYFNYSMDFILAGTEVARL